MSQLQTVLRRSVAHIDPSDRDGRERMFTSAREAMIRLLWSYDPPLTPSEIDSKIDEFDRVASAILDEDGDSASKPTVAATGDGQSSLITPEPSTALALGSSARANAAPLSTLQGILMREPRKMERFAPLSEIGSPTPTKPGPTIKPDLPTKPELATKSELAVKPELAIKADLAVKPPVARPDASIFEALAALDSAANADRRANRDNAIVAKTTSEKPAVTPEDEDDWSDWDKPAADDESPEDEPREDGIDALQDDEPQDDEPRDDEPDERDDGAGEADASDEDKPLDEEPVDDEFSREEEPDEAEPDDGDLEDDATRRQDEDLDDEPLEDDEAGQRLSDDVHARHNSRFDDRDAFEDGEAPLDDEPLDEDEPRRSLGERARDFASQIGSRTIAAIAGVVLLLVAGLAGATFLMSRGSEPATTVTAVPPPAPTSEPGRSTEVAATPAPAPEASPRPTPPAAEVATGALALETLSLFDGRDPSVFQSAPDNPVRFEGDTQGGFARVSSSTNSTGSRITVGRGVYERLAGRTVRIVVVARAAATSPANTLRFAYQNGRSLSPWQDGSLGKEYAPLSTTWTVPKDRGGPETDAILIEPGIPGDGTAADIKSVRIEVLK